VPWKAYKNAHYEKRGFTLAGKDWHQWEDLPEGPLKYAGVKVRRIATRASCCGSELSAAAAADTAAAAAAAVGGTPSSACM
jgi:hypothetical protein